MSNRISNYWSSPLAICIFLVAIVWAVFGQTRGHDFINYDDDLYVYDNPQVMSGITLPGMKWAFTGSHAQNWHPLTTISHMLDCQIYGAKPAGHHLTNVALHSLAVVLLFLVLRQMTGALWRSAFVATLFAIHPLHVESVAWVAERKDVLSGVFFMLTLGAYAHYARKPTGAGYLAVLILFACGLMSKSMLVTLPFVLLLLDYWPLGRFTDQTAIANRKKSASWWERQSVSTRLILEKLPLLALSVAASVVTLLIQSHDATFGSAPLPLRIYNASVSAITYIGQMIWPWRLAPFYPYPSGRLSILVPVFALAGLVFITYKAWVLRNRYPYFIVGWFWYLGMLVPVIGIIQTGLQAHADRYTYLPHIGLYLLVTWAFADFAANWSYRLVVSGVASAVVIIALSVAAWKQTSHWKNSETLWTHALAVTSRNDVAHLNLGVVFLEDGRLAQAIANFRAAIEIRPDNEKAHLNLGAAFLKEGRLDEAIANFRAAIEIRPEYAKAHSNLATALMRQGNAGEAFLQWQKSLQLQPENVIARDNLGLALARQGRMRDAMAQWQESLKYDRDDRYAQNKLAWVLATAPDPSLRDGVRAVQLAERALQLSAQQNAAVFQTLAAAYAETGRFPLAIEAAKRGLELATEQKDFALAAELRQRISVLETNTPIRDSALETSTTSP